MNAKPIFVVGLTNLSIGDFGTIQKDLDKKMPDYHILLYGSERITDPEFQIFNAPDADEKSIEEIKQIVKEALK
jgi:hypothetical protein